MNWIGWITHAVEIAGIAIIVTGAFGSLARFLWQLGRGAAGGADARGGRGASVAAFRSNLGQSILLGLEFLVAADIINTVGVEPTLSSLAVLAGIVAIRTFLSFSLEVEIEGRWPWQRGRDRDGSDGDDATGTRPADSRTG